MNKVLKIFEKPKAIYFLCLIYSIHMVEEFSLGFVEWADKYFGYFNWTQNLIGNTIFMILLIAACYIYVKNPKKNQWIGMAGVMWVLTNAFIHLSATILGKEYSPGLITALVLYIPVGVGFLIMWKKNRLLNAKNILLSFLVGGFIVMLLPTFVRAIINKAELAKIFNLL